MQELVRTGKYTEINKQSNVKFWLNWIKLGAVSYSSSCTFSNQGEGRICPPLTTRPPPPLSNFQSIRQSCTITFQSSKWCSADKKRQKIAMLVTKMFSLIKALAENHTTCLWHVSIPMRSLLCLALMHLGLRYILGHIGYQLISSDGLWSFYLVGLKVKKEMTNLGNKGISFITYKLHTHCSTAL